MFQQKLLIKFRLKAFDYLDAPVVKINTADTPAPYSPVLLEEWLPNSSDVVKAVKKYYINKITRAIWEIGFSIVNHFTTFVALKLIKDKLWNQQ